MTHDLKPNTLIDWEEVELRLTEMASQQIVPVTLLRPEARADFDLIANMAILTFRGQLVTSDKTTQHSTFEYVERWRPWWLPKFVWSRIPSRKSTRIMETKYAATHPYADMPDLQEKLGPVAVKTIRNAWTEHSK